MSAGSNAGDRLQWEDLRVAPAELRPDSTLTMGQCFNWKKIDCGGVEDKYWIGMLGPHALIIRQQLHTTEYLSLGGEALQPLLWDYFQLDFQLAHLYEQWGAGCERMQIVTERIRGVRVVRQDPWECLISFICSSNNNIARIGQMLDKLRLTYGTYRCSLGGYLHRHDLYDFPTAESLAAASEADLRALGMGYRAKFIKGSAQLVVDKTRAGEAGWFEQMRGIAQAAQAQLLLELPGVGRKVADCVALFSLDQTAAIPVDTHVWNIAIRDYAPELR
ncbi:DNA glycosylase, partial [Ochromonadaceae sp. CCMP2298]